MEVMLNPKRLPENAMLFWLFQSQNNPHENRPILKARRVFKYFNFVWITKRWLNCFEIKFVHVHRARQKILRTYECNHSNIEAILIPKRLPENAMLFWLFQSQSMPYKKRPVLRAGRVFKYFRFVWIAKRWPNFFENKFVHVHRARQKILGT